MSAPATVNAAGAFRATEADAAIGEAVLRMQTATKGSLVMSGCGIGSWGGW